MTITPELRQAIEQSGGAPIRLEDPQSSETYVLLRASAFDRIQRLLEPLLSQHDDFQVSDAYASADETFREGWEAPGMSEYDDYEKHRP
jgi:hypothetical protein